MNTDGEESLPHPSGKPRLARRLRNYLIAGLLIWIPILVTIWVLRFLTGILDQALVLLPHAWRPRELFGFDIRGWGLLPSLLLLLGTGLVVHNLLGRRIVHGMERLVRRIPLLGAIYGGAKTFSETVLTEKGRTFREVVLVEFPRQGVFSIGFITANEIEELKARMPRDLACVFVPHTPNAATGFLVMVPRNEIVRLDMSAEEAFKLLVTLGVVVPHWHKRPVDGRLAPPPGGP